MSNEEITAVTGGEVMQCLTCNRQDLVAYSKIVQEANRETQEHE